MEDNRKYAGYSDREYLCWFVKKDKGSLAFVLIMCIAWIGTWIVSLFIDDYGTNLLAKRLFPFFQYIVYPIITIFYTLFVLIHWIKCCCDYYANKNVQTDKIRIQKYAYFYHSADSTMDLYYYIAKTSKGKKRLFKINNDRIVWDQEKSVKTKRNIGGKTVYVPKEPRIEIGKTYKVTYYPISKLVVRAEEVK